MQIKIPVAQPIETLPRRREDFPDRFPPHRCCSKCDHRLSVWNEGPHCNACVVASRRGKHVGHVSLAELLQEAP